MASGWPARRGCRRVLARRGWGLPGGHLAGHRRAVGLVYRRDRPLLVGRDVRGGGSLENGLAAPQQLQQPALVDVEVAGQTRILAGREGKLAALELPEQVEGLASSPDAPAAGMRQGTGLERIDPVAAWLSQFEHARLATVNYLIEQAEQAESVDRTEGWRLGRAAPLVRLSLLKERHAPTTI